jgi:hypothetical protein
MSDKLVIRWAVVGRMGNGESQGRWKNPLVIQLKDVLVGRNK